MPALYVAHDAIEAATALSPDFKRLHEADDLDHAADDLDQRHYAMSGSMTGPLVLTLSQLPGTRSSNRLVPICSDQTRIAPLRACFGEVMGGGGFGPLPWLVNQRTATRIAVGVSQWTWVGTLELT
jgi:hypothetical protein